MDRRQFVTTLGIAAIAGCAGGSDPGEQASETDAPPATTSSVQQTTQASPEATTTANSENTVTETASPAEFELVSVAAPDEAEINEEISYEFTVKNVGESAGLFETTVSTREGTGSWSTSDSPWTAEIGPGEEETLQSQTFTSPYMAKVDIRIDAFDRTVSIQFVSKKLAFLNEYTTPEGVVISARGVSFKQSYSWSSGNYDYTEEASDGNTYAFVEFRAANESGQPQYLPTIFDIVVIVDNSQYDAEISYKQNGNYEGGEVQSGVVREGRIIYEVPKGTNASGMTVAWSKDYFEGPVAVYWSASGE